MARSVSSSNLLSPLLLFLRLLRALTCDMLQVGLVFSGLNLGFVLLSLCLLGCLVTLLVLLALRLVFDVSEAHIFSGLYELIGTLSLFLLALLVGGGLFRRVLALLVGALSADGLGGAELN